MCQGFANTTFLGLAQADLSYLATGIKDGIILGGSMAQLDDASTYFDLGPRAVSGSGTYYYMVRVQDVFRAEDVFLFSCWIHIVVLVYVGGGGDDGGVRAV